jgi:phosphohistidine phosphatase
MQRRVTLMRHGHAEEKADDYARKLSDVGRASAMRAGRALAKAGLTPQHLLTSSAPRALTTAKLVAEACGYRGAIFRDRSLYLATESRYLAALQGLPSSTSSVLLVGHNPGLTGLARELCQHIGDLAPAEYVSAQFELDAWSELL